MNQLSRLFLILPLTLAFTSCSPSAMNPFSDRKVEVAEKTLRERIDTQSKGQIKLVKFTKTNGEFVLGNNLYHLFFAAEIEFQADGLWRSHDFMHANGLTYSFTPGAMSREAAANFGTASEGGM